MCVFALVLSVDPSLGRLDYSLLSDQALMEMLIEGLDDETKKENQDSNGMYLDVCEWPCIKCDDDERIIEIEIHSRNVSGSLELRYVSPKVKVLDISSWRKSMLTGSVDLAHLPFGMEDLNLKSNQFSGEINLTHLPDRMQRLSLENNQFTGEIDLAHLPYGVELLFLNGNQFSGKIDLTQLPHGMHALHLNKNQLTGEIDLTHLPDEMQRLFLGNNQLTGSLVINKLPQGMIMTDVQGNHFNAIAVVDCRTDATIKLKGSGVTSVSDGNGRELDMSRFLM